jgi:tRNA threonylcarbamoyladenosine biosynthesis protein TsaB
MLLLAIDTSGKNGSIALARVSHGQSGIEIVEVLSLDGGAFSAQLVPQIAKLLEKHGCSKNDLAAFAVVSGPGSFTGLRVGLAAIKALAEALKKPIAAVSILEAIACGTASHGRVLAVLDAGRTDVYVGEYEIEPGDKSVARMQNERLLTREKFLAETAAGDLQSKTIVTPDPGLATAFRASGSDVGLNVELKVELIEYPDSGVIARLGWEQVQRGQVVLPEELQANYIGHSDAEIYSKPAR